MVRVRWWERRGCITTARAEPERSPTSRLLPHDGLVVGLASRVRLEAEMEVGFPWTCPRQVCTPQPCRPSRCTVARGRICDCLMLYSSKHMRWLTFTHLGDDSFRCRKELRSDPWFHERIAGGVFHHPLMMLVMRAHYFRFVLCTGFLQSTVHRGRLAQDQDAYRSETYRRARAWAHAERCCIPALLR